MKTFINIMKSGNILTNFFLSGYLIFLHEIVYEYFFYDSVLSVSNRILHEGSNNYFFGLLLIIIIIIEVVAFYWKTRYDSEVINPGGSIFILWIFHTVIGIIMMIFALEALGMGFDDDMMVVTTFALFAAVIKELFIFGIMATTPEKKKNSKIKAVLSDVFFGIFYSFAFTIVIGNFLSSPNYNNYLLAFWYSKLALVMNLFVVILIFFIFYMPLRMPYFLYSENRSLWQKLLSKLSIILVCILTILPLFRGEYSLERALEKPGEVRILFLNSRDIENLSPEIEKLTELRVLHLGYNKLTTLPGEFSKLDKLIWLNLGGNRFDHVPEEVLKLKSLKELDVHYNNIQFLPENLAPFMKMNKITLRSNRINETEKQRIIDELGADKISFN